MAEVTLENVAKAYGDVTALSGIDLAIRDGEFFTLVGPSGCGKTTTLRAIAGFEAPGRGVIRFDGAGMAGVPPEERDVGIVFQSYALFPHMDVAENVGYGLRFRDPPGGVPKRKRVEELLELVDLAGFGDRDPDELSGGQQQRVALARALAPGPELLLLDEPMSALDARLRERLRIQVREIQQRLGITTIYVTHDQAEALAVSDRVAVMNDGRVEQVGTPKDVYRRPATRFVAEFVGDNNVFSGPVRERDGGSAVDVDGTSFRVPDARGDRATFCVRPESLVADAETNRFTAEVRAVEFLGEAFKVHLDWHGREIVLRAEEEPTSDRLVLGFDPADTRVVE